MAGQGEAAPPGGKRKWAEDCAQAVATDALTGGTIVRCNIYSDMDALARVGKARLMLQCDGS